MNTTTNPNQGIRNLVQLAEELERQKQTKKDFVVESSMLRAEPIDGVLNIAIDELDGGVKLPLTEYAHGQLADKTKIPKKYYDRILESGRVNLLADNVNAWLPDKDKRMIRTLDGQIRAIVSDRYKTMDNADVLFHALEQFRNYDAEIVRADLSETNLYIKAIIPHEEYLTADDPLKRGVIIRNSEVGAGAFRVEPFCLRLVCSNGMISTQTIRKFHLGSQRDLGVFTNETLEQEDKLTWLQIKDIIKSTFDPEHFEKWMQTIHLARDTEVLKPVEVFDHVVKEYQLGEGYKKDLLNHFVRDRIAGNTVWGVANAVTQMAHELENYDRAIYYEEVGAKILEDKRVYAIAGGL